MKNQNQAKGMKFKLLTIGLSLITFVAKAQFTGPVSNVLSTSNYVNIAGVQVMGLPGGPASSPLFTVSTAASPNVLRFSVDHNRIDANTNFYINSASFYVNRTGSVPGNALAVMPAGSFTLNTNGIVSPSLGFFINSNNRNFFTITEEQILFKDATQDLFKVNANGYLSARKVIVTLQNPFADYVFDKNYKLKTLPELEAFITKHHHLPNVPSLAEVEANNKQIDVGEMQIILLEKVEELTLYILQQQKEIEALKVKLAE
jgi:hypothetical protein